MGDLVNKKGLERSTQQYYSKPERTDAYVEVHKTFVSCLAKSFQKTTHKLGSFNCIFALGIQTSVPLFYKV